MQNISPQELVWLNDYFQAIFANTLDIVIITSHTGEVCEFNSSAEQVFGYTRAEMIGQSISILLVDGVLDMTTSSAVRHEVNALRKNGEQFLLEVSSSCFELLNESLYINIARDISQRKHVEVMIREYADKLEEKQYELMVAHFNAEQANRMKTEFLANMSHELRTPLNAILGFARQGIQRIDRMDKDTIKRNFTIIHESGERLLHLLNNLLDIASLEAKNAEFSFKDVDINLIVNNVFHHLDADLQEKQLTVAMQLASDLPHVELDKDKITQVLANLLKNAIKYSHAGGSITVSSELQGDQVKVSLQDQGIGIPQQELETVFDKFVQSSKSKTGAGGTGLGLAISKEIIQGHQGKIWAESDGQSGSVFSFCLPIHHKSQGELGVAF